MVRDSVYRALEEIETPLGRGVNVAIALLVLLSCGIFVAQTYPLPGILRLQLDGLDKGLLVLFSIEYFLRLWVAKNRLRYIFSFYALIDLLAILPVFVGLFNVEFLRIIRGLRILRILRFVEDASIFGYVIRADAAAFIRIIITFFIIVFIYSGLIYRVEHNIQLDNFGSFLDAVYYSIATLSTVGFGDVVPRSQLGRALSILMIITGVVLIPWQAGELVRRLVQAEEKEKDALAISASAGLSCQRCGLDRHDADARFCKRCGLSLLKDD
jgi:voltage-gated potassium channel